MAKYITLIAMLTINVLSTLPLSELIRFHIKIRKSNITTFEYLKQQDKVKKQSRTMVKI